MNTNNNTIWIVTLLVLVGLTSFYVGKNSNRPITEDANMSTSTQTAIESTHLSATTSIPKMVMSASSTLKKANTSGFHMYSDSQNNFFIKYPPFVTAKNTFTTFHEIGNNWRVNADQANQGKPVLALSIFSLDQGGYSTGKQTYPLYFMSEVRIGISPNIKECYAPDAGYTNQKITNVTINGVSWKKFSSQDAAMMKYVQVESYRTIHNNTCFAVEQIKNGSNYRDEKMTTGKTDNELANYFATGNTIIQTFTFTK